MKLIKVGDDVLNMDLMFSAHLSDPKSVTLYFAVTAPTPDNLGQQPQIVSLEYFKAQAEALRRYLTDQAIDILPVTAEDSAYSLFRQKGGALTRTEWRQAQARLESFHKRSDSWWSNERNKDEALQLEADLLL